MCLEHLANLFNGGKLAITLVMVLGSDSCFRVLDRRGIDETKQLKVSATIMRRFIKFLSNKVLLNK